MVTTVLASYRGFDTFGETVVVFAAGLGVLLLLGGLTRTGRATKAKGAVAKTGPKTGTTKAAKKGAK